MSITVTYAATDTRDGTTAQVYRNGRYFGVINQSFEARWGAGYAGQDMPHVILHYGRDSGGVQVGFYALPHSVATAIEDHARLASGSG